MFMRVVKRRKKIIIPKHTSMSIEQFNKAALIFSGAEEEKK